MATTYEVLVIEGGQMATRVYGLDAKTEAEAREEALTWLPAVRCGEGRIMLHEAGVTDRDSLVASWSRLENGEARDEGLV